MHNPHPAKICEDENSSKKDSEKIIEELLFTLEKKKKITQIYSFSFHAMQQLQLQKPVTIYFTVLISLELLQTKYIYMYYEDYSSYLKKKI